jgi:FANCL C-terminal domain
MARSRRLAIKSCDVLSTKKTLRGYIISPSAVKGLVDFPGARCLGITYIVDATKTCPDAEDFDAREEYVDVTECTICLCTFAEDRVCEAKNAKCKRMYHQECLEPWLLRYGQCSDIKS